MIRASCRTVSDDEDVITTTDGVGDDDMTVAVALSSLSPGRFLRCTNFFTGLVLLGLDSDGIFVAFVLS